MSKDNNQISFSVIKRMPRYYRFLGELKEQGEVRISSGELAKRMGLTASQIRQDFNCFGGFGQQGYGYNVDELHDEIGRILGVDSRLGAVMIGAGNLGKAIALHLNFEKRGCRLEGIFDINPLLVGMNIGGIAVMPLDRLEAFCERYKPRIAILCIPKASASDVADRLRSAGICAFWNFSHYDLRRVDDSVIENVHLGDSLQTLIYRVNHNDDSDNNDETEK